MTDDDRPKAIRAPKALTARAAAGALAACLLMTAGGCGNYNALWRQATTRPVEQGDPLVGAWEGAWTSDVREDGGRLRCLIARRTDGRYDARFRATYWGLLTASYTIALTTEKLADIWRFNGQEDLGFMAGGIYGYEGYTDGVKFVCAYSSTYDEGMFRMKRVAKPTKQAPPESKPSP